MQLKNDRLLRALFREPVDVTPIWIMRQAGRYLPEYRKIREKAGSFLTLCKTPALACEVTLQPLKRFSLDAAILFSDILTIPDAMGLGLYFKEGEGPAFKNPISSKDQIDNLIIPDPEVDLKYVLDAIRMIQEELSHRVPLIGFCGSPWTIACYMIEGKAQKSFPRIQAMMSEEPALLHSLLKKIAKAVTLHLNAQIKAGVNVVMLFDTWGGLLNTDNYQHFSLQYMQWIIRDLLHEHNGQRIPSILFTKNGGQWLELIADSGCDAAGIDWLTNLNDARRQVGNKIALQGNLDPSILLLPPDNIRKETQRILQEYGQGSGHVFNLGHGITPDVSPESVAVLVDAVHEFSCRYHQGRS